MRKFLPILLAFLLPVLISANAIPGMSTERPRFAAHILKIQLSSEAISQTDLPTEYNSRAESFGIEELDKLAASFGTHKIIRAHIRMKDREFEQKTGFDRWFLIVYDEPLNVMEALRAFKAYPLWIQDAIPEYYAYTTAVPNDTYYPNNWGHNNTAQLPVYTGGSHSGAGVGTIGFDSDAQLAWDQSQGYGSASIIIAIIDTGVDTAHPDLRLVAGYDYGVGDNNPMDDSADPGHGTACSGVAAGRANNALGVTGIAGGCSVMPLKIADANGDLYFTAIENAITHTGNNGVHVASMSFGAEGGTAEGSSPSTDTALEYAYSHGVTLLAATANSNTSTIAYPSNHNKVISVGASSPTGQRKSDTSSDGEYWWGSNYGVATQDNQNAVDIMAPTILPATDITGTGGYDSGNYSMWFNGTSCATPYAAGVAGLIKSRDPSLTPAQVRTAMTSTATDMTFDGGAGWDRYTGYGMVNANNALLSLVPGMPSCTITAPTAGAVFDLNSTLTVNVTATDTDGIINSVAFYIDDVLQNTDYSSPWTWNWNSTGFAGGSHTIKAIATDNASNTATSTVGVSLLAPPNEGFETGNFSAYAWVNGSAVPWTVQSSEKFSGTYAAKSGTITHNGTTTISLPAIVSSSGTISFYYKVSSESGWDWLRFYIDGVQQAEWSGTAGWAAASYPVTSGSRTFAWTYSKDGSVSSGSDCAWIDHIIFPPMETYYAPPQNLTALAFNGYVNLMWQAPASGSPTGYKVFRNGSLIGSIAGLGYTDDTVINETTYSYHVTAVYVGGESAASNTVNATPTAVVTTEVIIGSGTASTGTQEASPINVYYKSLHGQAVYTVAELNAAGVYGPINITQIGFNVTGLPSLAMPNFIVRMGHTTASNVASWISTGLTQLLSIPSYQPAATGWNVLTLSSPFVWNGTDNLLVDTAFGDIGSYTTTGTVQYTSITSGYRYVRLDTADQTNVFTGGSTSTYRPNLKLTLQPLTSGPMIEVNPSAFNFGPRAIGSTSTQQFTISNSGGQTLSGTITTPTGFSVAEVTRDSGLDRSRSGLRNTLPFSVNVGQSRSFDLVFTPTTAGSYNGSLAIISNAENSPNHQAFITASGVLPPAITLSTDELTSAILPDETDTQSFNIGNSGGQTLNYSLALQELRSLNGSLRTAQGRNIEGSTLVLNASSYSPGTTVDWTFTVTNASTDDEWLENIYIEFPNDVTVNSATGFVGGSGGPMTPDFTSGNGITIHWHGMDSQNWGVVLPGQSAVATVNVTIPPYYPGDLLLQYQIEGDVYGAEPHILYGSILLPHDWTPLDWFDLSPVSGTVAPGGSVPIEAYFDSAALIPGQYLATLLVNSNDPVHPQMTIDVTLNVQDPNQPPEIIPPDVIAFAKNDTYVEDFSPYVSDPDSDPLSLQASGNSHIQIAIDGLSVTFNAIDGWTGQEEVTFTVSDGDLEASAVVYVSSYNTPPTIDLPDEGFTFTRNGSLTVDLAPYGNDADGDELSIDFSGDTHIDVQLDGSSANFSSIDGWVGSEIITFSVFDGTDQTSDTVEITVTNSAPTLDLPDSWSFGHNSFLAVDMGLYGGDDDGDVLELTWIGNTNILIIQNGPTISLSSPDGWVGTENVTFTFNDGYAQTSDTVEIIATNSAPELTLPDGWSLPRNGTLEVDLAPFVTDYDGDPLIFGTSGTTNVETNFDGSVVTFYAPSGWVGTETVTFVINDGIDSGTDTAEITVTNSAPAFNLPTSWSFDQDTVGILDLNVYASDPEADALSYQFSGNVHIAIGIVDGILTATPDPGWYGTESITITVSDGLLEASDSWDIVVEHVISALDTPVVIISMTAGSVVLDWQSVPDATEYLILASADPYGIFTQIGSSVTNHFETPLTDDMAFFQVKALYEPEAK